MSNKNLLNGSIFEFTKKPKKIVFLLHGYGDNGENFIPIAKYLHTSKMAINFYAPNAPSFIPQQFSGLQWFDLYPNGVHYSNANEKEKKIIKNDCEVSVQLLKNYIENLCFSHNLSYSDCFILGFSQGAMMAFELGKYLNSKLSGCIMISGRILSFQKIDKSNFLKTPIMILHGDNDELVDPKYFFEASDFTKSNKMIVENHLIKDEGHTISIKMLQLVRNFLEKYM